MTSKRQSIASILLGFAATLCLGLSPVAGQTESPARVVRLSFVEGHVSAGRPDNAEWAEAPVNTPIEEGFKLSTSEDSFAEVEFENGSTVRLGQLSRLEFTQLALAPDGSKINRLSMDMGYATFRATPEAQDVYEVVTPDGVLTPRGKALFRVDVDASEQRVEVFKGFVDIAGSLGSWTLSKNSVLELSPGADQSAELSEGITEDDWDRWVKERESEAEAASHALSPNAYTDNGDDNAYGWSDLAYYGDWSYMPGFGYGWIPNVNVGWYPYSQGRWCWYPGFGYVWISTEPWGWLPYHFGGWEFIPGIGWVWFPGNFGVWSPGLVNWYWGSGWIGWTPRHGLPRPVNPRPCPQGQRCGTAISTGAFKNGRPVRPGTILAVNPESGNRIERPAILPDRQAMLPGRVVSPPAQVAKAKVYTIGPRGAASSTKSADVEPTPASVAGVTFILGGPAAGSSGRHAAPGPRAGIVYDPAGGRYVNNPRQPSGSVQAPNGLAGRSLPSGPEASPSGGVQPVPGTQPNGGHEPTSRGYYPAEYHHSSPRSDSGSEASPRSGGTTLGGKAPGGSATSGGGSTGGAARGGGGGAGGGSHAGGGGGGSSGGGRH